MSYTLSIRLIPPNAANAQVELDALLSRYSQSRLQKAVGPALVTLFQRHFRALQHNRKGWAPVNFWPDAARATTWDAVAQGVQVSVNKIGVRQRWLGGEIRPVKAKALTIPIAEEAYGKTARGFGRPLQLVIIRGKAYLAESLYHARKLPGTKTKAGNKPLQGPGHKQYVQQLKFLFRLVSRVVQSPDPSVVPDIDTIRGTAIDAIVKLVPTTTP